MMSKISLVLKNEFISTVTRRSFIITLLLIPIASFIMMLVVSILGTNTGNVVSQIFTPSQQLVHEGYVDESGIIQKLPPDYDPARLIAYSNRTQADLALKGGEISGYYIVPKDYLAKGEVTIVQAKYNPFSAFDNADVLRQILKFNLLGGDFALFNKYNIPANVETFSQAPATPSRDQENMLTFFLPYIVTMLFYIVILTSSSLMLNSVTIEKQNRVIEILMSSITPIQMLVGKIIALGLVGLLQTITWSGASYLLLKVSGKSIDLGAFQLPPSILIWGVIYFLLGYAVYASLMAGIGALVPNLREASQATTVVIIPVIIPLLLISALINAPDGALATVLSIFPLTAPIAMMTRLAATSVPIWQHLLAVGLLSLTALLILRSVAGMFRAQTLLSGQAFNMKVLFKALLGQA
jgi:ABC-2 type transport system permease protein